VYPDEPIFLLSDGPHNDKKGRNSAEKSFNPSKRDASKQHLREIMVPAGPGGELLPVKWTDMEALLMWDERQTPRLTKLTKAHIYLNPFSRMRCGLSTEAFEAVFKYASQPPHVKHGPGAPGDLEGLVWYCTLWHRLHQLHTGKMTHRSSSCRQLWDGMQQIISWWAAVEQEHGKHAQRHFMSAEVTFDVQAMGHGLLGLTQWLDSKASGFELSCKKLNQNDVECAFSILRASGANRNPTTQDCARGIAGLRYANIHSKVPRGASYEQEEAEHSDQVFKQQLAAKQEVCHTHVWLMATLEPAAEPEAAPGQADISTGSHLAAALLRQVGDAPLDSTCRSLLLSISKGKGQPELQERWSELCRVARAAANAGSWHQAHNALLTKAAQELIQQMPAQTAAARTDAFATAEERQQRAASQVSTSLCGVQLCTSWVCCYMLLAWSLLRLRVFNDHTLVAEAKAAAKQATAKQGKRQRKQRQQLLDPSGTDPEAEAMQALPPDGTTEAGILSLEMPLEVNDMALAHVGGWALLKVQQSRTACREHRHHSKLPGGATNISGLIGMMAEKVSQDEPAAAPPTQEAQQEQQEQQGQQVPQQEQQEQQLPRQEQQQEQRAPVKKQPRATQPKAAALAFFDKLQQHINRHATQASLFLHRHAAYNHWLEVLEQDRPLWDAWQSCCQELLMQPGAEVCDELQQVLREMQGMVVQRYMHAMQLGLLKRFGMSGLQKLGKPPQALRTDLLGKVTARKGPTTEAVPAPAAGSEAQRQPKAKRAAAAQQQPSSPAESPRPISSKKAKQQTGTPKAKPKAKPKPKAMAKPKGQAQGRVKAKAATNDAAQHTSPAVPQPRSTRRARQNEDAKSTPQQMLRGRKKKARQ
jgi:hypothetical protein